MAPTNPATWISPGSSLYSLRTSDSLSDNSHGSDGTF